MITLLNADLADTLGNLIQRVTAKKLNPTMKDEGERPESSQLASEWSKMSNNKEDSALVDHLSHLTGYFCIMQMPIQ